MKNKALPQPPSAIQVFTPPVVEPKRARKRRSPETIPAGKPHDFEPNSWLNSSNGSKTCRVCGVEEYSSTAYIDADHAGMSQDPVVQKILQSKKTLATTYTYVDAKQNMIHSPIRLGCPVFMRDHKGETMANKERLRQVGDRIDETEDRIDSVIVVADDHEVRLADLEVENARLRARVDASEADIGAVVQWLTQMVAIHKANNLETIDIQVEGRGVAALPPPVVDLIFNLSSVTTKDEVDVLQSGHILEGELVKK